MIDFVKKQKKSNKRRINTIETIYNNSKDSKIFSFKEKEIVNESLNSMERLDSIINYNS